MKTKNTGLAIFLLAAITMTCMAQENRTIDGTYNNTTHFSWGASGSPLKYFSGFEYADGIGMPGGQERPNSRELSNVLFTQEDNMDSPMGLSDFVWSFGQFIDHDITAIEDSETEAVMIAIPTCDEYFDPFCTGEEVMPIHRNAAVPGT